MENLVEFDLVKFMINDNLAPLEAKWGVCMGNVRRFVS
jgi:hypothetical protein